MSGVATSRPTTTTSALRGGDLNRLESWSMDKSAFLKWVYGIVAAGACVLMVLAWALVDGDLSPRAFAVAALVWWIAMFSALFRLIRSRQRSAEDIRRKQIASGVPATSLDRDQCVRNIRTMKRLIGVFAVFLGYGLLATQGQPLLPRAVGAAIDLFFLAACAQSLVRSQKKLKDLPADRATGPSA